MFVVQGGDESAREGELWWWVGEEKWRKWQRWKMCGCGARRGEK